MNVQVQSRDLMGFADLFAIFYGSAVIVVLTLLRAPNMVFKSMNDVSKTLLAIEMSNLFGAWSIRNSKCMNIACSSRSSVASAHARAAVTVVSVSFPL